MSLAIQFENISKRYRLGQVGTGTLSRDLERLWAKLWGKPDPLSRVGEVNDREKAGGEYVWALRDVSFDVLQGEVLGIVGRNGAGKSTLLKLLSRVTAPTSGRFRAKGRIASLLEVGTGFNPELTGRENIYLNGAILGMTRREIAKHFEEIVEFSGCAKFVDTPVKRYSSGMTVRLGFAVAAHLDCEILVVDEVLAVGDVDFQTKCIGKMRDVSRDGRTILLVTHNLSTIMDLTSKCALFHNGTLQQYGSTDSIVESYLQNNSLVSNTYLPDQCSSRRGSGFARFTNIKVSSASPRTFQPCKFEIEVSTRNEYMFQGAVEIALSILSNKRAPLLQLYSKNERFSIILGKSRYQCSVSVPSLPLVPGRYPVNLWMGSGSTPIDWLEGAFELEVYPSNLDAHSCVADTGFPVVVQSQWSDEPEVNDDPIAK